MDAAPLLAALPIEQRLALAYASKKGRSCLLAVFALDARLAGIVRASREPLLAQARLAWWRDRFASEPATWPEGEPLLALLRESRVNPAVMGELVNGWEHLLAGASLSAVDIEALLAARTAVLQAGGEAVTGSPVAGLDRIARRWALADLASRLSEPDERELVCTRAAVQEWQAITLPRDLRPLAVLGGLAMRCRTNLGRPLLSGPASAFAALRIGLLGV